jgi:hypothetical protein
MLLKWNTGFYVEARSIFGLGNNWVQNPPDAVSNVAVILTNQVRVAVKSNSRSAVPETLLSYLTS